MKNLIKKWLDIDILEKEIALNKNLSDQLIRIIISNAIGEGATPEKTIANYKKNKGKINDFLKDFEKLLST